ncbi:hypothetical protein [Mesorhizobium amorphae]|uniref:hypothetical protein n=1 Tax=Mesorhizobium amorphae TaxID=71433 RepID=UPI00178644D1|nr:hypothetical protein [Mesorhizobium amorphae]
MALDILTQDIIIDETTGLQDDDVNPSVPPHSTNTTLQYLLTLDDAGGLTSPEVAYQANFVQATASAGETISSVVLTQSASGTPFSTTVGVNSGIRTADGDYVWLFQDPTNANVVIGVIGTSDPAAEPIETGPLAFSLGLVSTSATNADLYTVQYVPLLHPDATNPDDRIDLTNKVFASVTGTSVANFAGSAAESGNHEFYLINSSSDASKQLLVIGLNGGTANVSTQGFGINNQSINPNETLQVDFVTGGTLAAGDAAEIQYGSHLETITQAGFTVNQVTPSNPDARVDVSISAFNNTGNEQGSDFFDGTPTSSVNITSVKLTGTSGFASTITVDGTYATGSGNVTVSGLGTGIVTITGLDNVTTVDVTTSSPMDRLQVKGVDANEGLDITEFHFTATTPNAHTEEVGSFINFDDDGPTVTAEGTVPTLTTDDTDIPDTTKDPAAGLQAGTAGGTLVFDKVADTYTITLTDPLEGFTFDIIHTSELLSKEPTSNTGHPQIVLEKLQADDPNTPNDEDFYVQFTANSLNNKNKTFSLTNNGEGSSSDTTFNSLPTAGTHDMVSNNLEDWVSATQTTNGVAGDTIQKGELLTLRFFNSNVGIQNEATAPTATAGAMAIKFDGIGNSEDLMLILNLVDNGADNIFGTGDDTSITRAVYVSNADIFKKGQVPTPYSSEFTLDNNDGLVIIEQNDYNAAGEEYLLQGVQIMQSGNGITGNGTAIDLNRTTGAGGGSNATTSLVNFDGADNDVLKITDIGFTTTVTETPEAHLDFAFQVEDADADQTAVQHILVDVA